FSDYYDLVSQIWGYFSSIYDLSSLKFGRLGVRYVNKILLKDGNPFDWSGYIAPSLVALIENPFSNKEEINRAMSQVSMVRDGYGSVVTFGLLNSSEFPAKISRREFVLDFDCATLDIQAASILDVFRKFNL